MHLDLDDERRALQEMVRGVLVDLAPLDRLRAAWPASPRSAEVWRTLAQTGLTGVGAPEIGGDEVDAAIVVEQAGYAVLDEPLADALTVVVPLLRAHATDEQRRRWLDPLVAGDARIGVALGADPWLADAESLDAALVEVDGELHLLATEELELASIATLDPAHPWSRVVAARRDAGSLLAGARPDDAAIRGAVGAAAMLIGLATRMLDVAVEHAKAREQFGRPIGAFQAVQHQLADVVTAVEPARAAVWYAAVRLRDGADDTATATAVAKVAANDAASLADRTSLQVLAGIGFTWEHDLHWMLKAASRWRAAYGDARHHRRRLAASLHATDDGGTTP